MLRTVRFPLLVLLSAAQAAPCGEPVEFNRDIRPILSDNCYLCHGPDKGRRKKGLRLDDRDTAIKKGAIVPGKPGESELVSRIFSDDVSERMPPEEAHKTLTARQKETLRRWIAEGAVYQPHWAYIVPKRPRVPQVQNSQYTVRNPIDAFLWSRLEKEHITPSPEADKRTLLRRLSFDLIGLPPTSEERHAFLMDTGANAYEKQVDRLLASPHFGERMAVPWLDLVRFADTVGYHGDQNQHVFPYRDYVIDSFNRNKPFDQFTREQLAGDLLPNATTETRVASAFNRLNMMTREGGAQAEEYLAKYAADRVRTLSIAWLGSTMGCAECHDHKFDPFTQRDFYSMEAFFADIKQWGIYADYDYTPNPDLKGWTNDHPFPPEISVRSPYLNQRMLRLRGELSRTVKESAKKLSENAEARAAYEKWLATARELAAHSDDGWIVPPVSAPTDRASVESDGSVLFIAKAAKGNSEKLTISPPAGWVAALRLELLPHAKHNGKITRDGHDSTSISLQLSVKRAADGKESKVGIFFGDADDAEPRYQNGSTVLGIHRGWKTPAYLATKPQTAVYHLDRPIHIAAGDQWIATVKSDNVGCARLAVSPFVSPFTVRPEMESALWLALTQNEREFAQSMANSPAPVSRDEILHRAYLLGTSWDREAFEKSRTLLRDFYQCRDGFAECMITEHQEPRTIRILPRGNWQDHSGAIVQPAAPAFLANTPVAHAPGSKRLTRLDLANWLTAPENPLTVRVFVNRLWKQFFGAGISSVMEDVGAQGEWPVHPELLDWLAVEFRESGWDVKHMVRLMVTSAAYRQSSRARPELKERDPHNRLVAFQSPRRLEAEFVRDNALAIAGLINLDIGGPSAFPYQPAGYYSQLQFPDRKYVADKDDRQYRRGVYTHWQRTFLHPMLANFDAPARDECTANRTVANTPQQALTLLNDPTFVECARALAAKLLAECDSDAARFERLFERALCRPPKPEEIEVLGKLLADERASRTDAEAWFEVCRAVLNLQETITRY